MTIQDVADLMSDDNFATVLESNVHVKFSQLSDITNIYELANSNTRYGLI